MEQRLQANLNRVGDRAIAIDVGGERHGLSRGDQDRSLQDSARVGHPLHLTGRLVADERQHVVLRRPVRADLCGQPEARLVDLDLGAVRVECGDAEAQHLAVYHPVTEIDALHNQLVGEHYHAATNGIVVVGAGCGVVGELRETPFDCVLAAAGLNLVASNEDRGGEDGGDRDDGAHRHLL